MRTDALAVYVDSTEDVDPYACEDRRHRQLPKRRGKQPLIAPCKRGPAASPTLAQARYSIVGSNTFDPYACVGVASSTPSLGRSCPSHPFRIDDSRRFSVGQGCDGQLLTPSMILERTRETAFAHTPIPWQQQGLASLPAPYRTRYSIIARRYFSSVLASLLVSASALVSSALSPLSVSASLESELLSLLWAFAATTCGS